MSAKGDPCSGSLPRHRNPDRFGYHDGEGTWVPYEVTEGRLLFSCGHSARIAVGSAPGVPEETVRAFVGKASEGQCAVCWSVRGRLRYQADTGKAGEERRARD